MTRFKGIIFDMDGTLVESEGVWEAAEREMFEDRGIVYTDAARQQVIGLRLDEFFEKLIRIFGLDETVDALQADLIARMLVKIPALVQPKPGAQEIIEWAAAYNIPYCIASSSPLVIIEAVVQSQGWSDLIPRLYTADDVARGKPAPDVYLYAAKQLGIQPAECVALEDSSTGAKAAVAAGMTCYVVPDFHTKPEAFASITPHLFPSLHEVLAQLKH